ncbi:unnamed protein product [Bursaphelenchus xylophilus]|uniref:RING-type E3 ubiquitin transferase n=1 Tax=Bursaphelenchus xylophilus TaxID=6326 RepID=A0A1I7SF97_BURXY|nr:unnamed protein product [Bursaphelenchus xylophilus]CAG9130450.1 unnamed protein product [Bursaphelenchus xylophilus]
MSPTKRHMKLQQDYKKPKRTKVDQDVKCPICLNVAEDLTLLSTCTHAFCYSCIVRWITQKANCPLCKVPVKLMKHNLPQKWEETDGYFVRGDELDAEEKIEESEFKEIRNKERPFTDEIQLMREVMNDLNVEKYKLTSTLEERSDAAEKIIAIADLARRSGRLSRRRFVSDPIFRFVAYSTNADRTTLIKTSTDVDVTPEYVEKNYDKLRMKIVPFVIRELRAITSVSVFSIDNLVELFLCCMKNMTIYKNQLQATLKSMGVRHPLTVYNTVLSFVSANQSLKLYDSNSRYVRRITLSNNFVEDEVNGQDDLMLLPAQPSSDDNDVMIVDELPSSSRRTRHPFPTSQASSSGIPDVSPLAYVPNQIRMQFRDMLKRRNGTEETNDRGRNSEIQVLPSEFDPVFIYPGFRDPRARLPTPDPADVMVLDSDSD